MSGSMIRDPLERQIVDWLDETAGLGVPDYLEDALARVEHVRQRPAWLSPGRWLPMRIMTLTRLETPRWVPYLVAVALLAVLIAAVALFVGSQRRLPPPFGLAAAGVLVLDAGGEILAIDPDGTSSRVLIGGPTQRLAATWSRDGRRVAYWSVVETTSDGEAMKGLWIADADGGNARRLFGDQSFAADYWFPAVSWSPDSRRLSFASSRGDLYVADADGSNLRKLGGDDIGRCCPAWSPDGSWIAFNAGPRAAVGQPGGQERLYVIRPDGTGETRVSTRSVSLPAADWSPDGSRLVYSTGDSDDLTIATGGPEGWSEELTQGAMGRNVFFPRWSNAGDRITFVTGNTLVVTRSDGSEPRLMGSSSTHVNIAAPCWSPDDRTIVALRVDGRDKYVEFEESAVAVFFDVETGAETASVPVSGIEGILACSWQRLAL